MVLKQHALPLSAQRLSGAAGIGTGCVIHLPLCYRYRVVDALGWRRFLSPRDAWRCSAIAVSRTELRTPYRRVAPTGEGVRAIFFYITAAQTLLLIGCRVAFYDAPAYRRQGRLTYDARTLARWRSSSPDAITDSSIPASLAPHWLPSNLLSLS